MSERTTAFHVASNELDAIIAEFLVAEEAQGPQKHEAWLARYPHFASELSSFLAYDKKVKNLFDSQPLTADFSGQDHLAGTEAFFAVHAADLGLATRGDLLGRDYRVLEVKQGGMGCVYFVNGAIENDTDVKCVFKTVLPFETWRRKRSNANQSSTAASYAALCYRFEREAMNWVRLPSHPNILEAMFVLRFSGRPHLILEYADCGDLNSWIQSGRLTVDLAVDFALQFCVGMSHATHRAGLIHRDIKPANILVHDKRQIKIADLGLAKAFYHAETTDAATELPQMEGISVLGAGTRAYMAPEQFASIRDADSRSDIFSFGATLFEMLTSRRLFVQTDPYNACVRNEVLPLAHQVNEEVPGSLGLIVAKCLAYNPGDRFQSFTQLATALADTGVAKRRLVKRKREKQEKRASKTTEQFSRETITLLGLRRFETAQKLAQGAISVYPDEARHWVNRGHALCELRRFNEALPCYQEAVKLCPDNAHYWADLALILDSLGRPEEAIRAAHRAVARDSECSEAWDALGICRLAVSNEAAIDCFQQAIGLNHQNHNALANLGVALAKENKNEDALYYLEKSVAINPNSMAWFTIATIRRAREQFTEALAATQRCLSADDTHGASWAMRGVLLFETANGARTQLAEAASCLQRAIGLGYDDVHIHNILSHIQSSLCKMQ